MLLPPHKHTSKDEKNTNLIEQACSEVKGYRALHEKFLRHIVVSGKSESTVRSYGTHLPKFS
jgi:hypothetical protein